jgi:hypothetical protein
MTPHSRKTKKIFTPWENCGGEGMNAVWMRNKITKSTKKKQQWYKVSYITNRKLPNIYKQSFVEIYQNFTGIGKGIVKDFTIESYGETTLCPKTNEKTEVTILR